MAKGYEDEPDHPLGRLRHREVQLRLVRLPLLPRRHAARAEAATGPDPGHAVFSAATPLWTSLDGAKRIEIEPTNPDGYDWPAKLKQPGVIVIGAAAGPQEGVRHRRIRPGRLDRVATAASRPRRPSRPGRSRRSGRGSSRSSSTRPMTRPPRTSSRRSPTGGSHSTRRRSSRTRSRCTSSAAPPSGRTRNSTTTTRSSGNTTWMRSSATGKFADGLKLLPRAAAAFPDEKDFSNPAEWVSRAASSQGQGGWMGEGLAFADVALKDLNGQGRRRHPRVEGQRSPELVAGSARRRATPMGRSRSSPTAWLPTPTTRNSSTAWSTTPRKPSGIWTRRKEPPPRVAHFQVIVKAFPKVAGRPRDGLQPRGQARWTRSTSAKKFAEALKAAAAYESIAGDKAANVACHVYDDWARSLAKDGKWEDAIKKYAEGLAAASQEYAPSEEWSHRRGPVGREGDQREEVGRRHRTL